MSKLFAQLAELYLGSLGWVDITSDVRGTVTITRGRTSEGNRADPGRCTLRLDNLSGNYSPRNPAGAYYGLLGRNTPLRVSAPLASDTFDGRTTSSGWGTSTSGHAWTAVGGVATDQTVSGGLARHAQAVKNTVRISRLGVDWREVDQVTDASIPAVAVGASVVVGHIARYNPGTGDYYWLRMEFNPGGTLTAKISRNSTGDLAVSANIPGLTYTAGQSWTFRSSVSGDRLAVKFWPTGTPEPVDWTLTATDRGLTAGGRGGLASWVVLGNTNTTEVRFDNYQAVLRRFYGEVSTWPPGWNLTGTDRYVDVEAAGILRRLGQGEQPSWSPMRRTIAATDPLAYWPLEDGTDAGRGGSAVSGAAPLTFIGTPTFATIEDWAAATGYTFRYGTAALVDLAKGTRMSGLLPADATTATGTSDGWTAMVAADLETGAPPLSANLVLLEVETPGGTYERWQLIITTTGRTQVWAFDAAGTGTLAVDEPSVITSLITHDIGVWKSGPTSISVGWLYDTSGGGYSRTGVITGSTVAGVTRVSINPTGTTATTAMPAGHLAVWAGHGLAAVDQNYGPVVKSLFSYEYSRVGGIPQQSGEPADVRLARLCTEAGLPVDPVAADPDPVAMGAQPTGKLADLLDQCTAADGGYLYESRSSVGLAYRTRATLYNQTPVPIAYVGQLAPPFEPVDDADEVRNDVTAKRTNGSSARVVETTGRLAALPPPDGVGVYQTSVELNLIDDVRLADQAGWRVHLGTVDADRYPALSVQLAAPEWQADPAAMAAVLSVDTGDVLEVTGLPSWAAGDARTLVTGYTEKISEYLWSITFAGQPAQPWDVAEVDGAARVPADGSTLVAAITAGATSLVLASTADNGPWTIDPADFPLDVRVGAERVTVSGIARPADDGFNRTVSNGWGTPDNAVAGVSWQPWTAAASELSVGTSLGSIAAASTTADRGAYVDVGGPDQDVTVLLKAPGTPTGATLRQGLVGRFTDASNHYRAGVAFFTGGTMAVELHTRIGGTLTLLSQVSVSLSNASDVWLRLQAIGTRIRVKAWQAATDQPSGWTVDVTDTTMPAGNRCGVFVRRESGNTAPTTVKYDAFVVALPQVATITARAVNGVAAAWPAGTEVDVWLPAVAAL